MSKNMWIGLVVVVAVLALGGWLIASNFLKSNEQAVNPNPTSQVTQASPSPMMNASEEAMMKKNMEVMESAMKDKDSLKADLKDVSGGTSTGTAFNLRKDGKLLFTATGKLPDPPAGSFYEGWVVSKAANKFEDAGKLEKQKDGTYEVSKEFDTTLEGYNLIVVTLEQVDDQKPEKHVLEGVAK